MYVADGMFCVGFGTFGCDVVRWFGLGAVVVAVSLCCEGGRLLVFVEGVIHRGMRVGTANGVVLRGERRYDAAVLDV